MYADFAGCSVLLCIVCVPTFGEEVFHVTGKDVAGDSEDGSRVAHVAHVFHGGRA